MRDDMVARLFIDDTGFHIYYRFQPTEGCWFCGHQRQVDLGSNYGSWQPSGAAITMWLTPNWTNERTAKGIELSGTRNLSKHAETTIEEPWLARAVPAELRIRLVLCQSIFSASALTTGVHSAISAASESRNFSGVESVMGSKPVSINICW